MKFLEINSIIKTNTLLSRMQAFDPQRSLEIEVYSCKQTREQKRHKRIPKPLRFYICALELAFPDYSFSTATLNFFRKIPYSSIKNELSFVFFTLYKNNEDVKEFINYLDALLDQCIDMKNTEFFLVDESLLDDNDFHRIYILHNRKRIIVIKSILEKQNSHCF
ncbi:hypothetical protein GINT2_001074 [Glugoides intestinalis]